MTDEQREQAQRDRDLCKRANQVLRVLKAEGYSAHDASTITLIAAYGLLSRYDRPIRRAQVVFQYLAQVGRVTEMPEPN